MITKLTTKTNSFQDHKIFVAGWIFTIAKKVHLRAVWIPGHCLHILPVWCQIMSEISVKSDELYSFFRGTSTSRSYCLLQAQLRHLEASPQSVVQVNPFWKDNKPLGTCRHVPKTLWGTYTDRQCRWVAVLSSNRPAYQMFTQSCADSFRFLIMLLSDFFLLK